MFDWFSKNQSEKTSTDIHDIKSWFIVCIIILILFAILVKFVIKYNNLKMTRAMQLDQI